MNKENTIPVLRGLYIFTRDNAKRGVWQYYFRLNGKVLRGTTGHTDIDDAKMEAIARYKAAKTDPESFVVKATSFKCLAERWLNGQKTDKDYTRKEMVVRRFLLPFFHDDLKMKDIRSLRQPHVTDFINWRRNYYLSGPGSVTDKLTYMRAGKEVVAKAAAYTVPKNSTMNRDNQVLRQIIAFAREEGLIPISNTVKVPKLKDDGERRPHFTPDQIKSILRMAERRVADAENELRRRDRRVLLGYVRLLRWTGMRTAEALSLTWRDVDFPNAKIYLRRGKTDERIIPMLFGELVTGLKELQEMRRGELSNVGQPWRDGEPMFVNKDNGAMRSFRTSFNNLLEACGLEEPDGEEDYCSYSFRHSLATELGNMGMPDGLLTKVLGTSREMIGAHYDHASADSALEWAKQRQAGGGTGSGHAPVAPAGALDLTAGKLSTKALVVRGGIVTI